MAKLSIKAGATSVSVGLFIQDSSSTTGAGLTGIAFNTSGLTCYAVVPGSSAAAITLATLAAANSAWSSGGFKEIDSTNMPGWYRFDIPNTNISTGRSVGIHLKGVTNMAPLPLEIELTGWDNQSTTDGGLSKLTSLTFTGANKVDASVRDWVGDTIPARSVTGVPKVDVQDWNGTAVSTPATAGIPEVNVKNINNVSAASVTTVNANLGTTQPINFTGTAGSALAKSDMVDVAGAAVSTSTAQIGVNAVNWAGGAIPAVNVTGVPLVDLKYTLGTISPATAGSVRADAVTGAVGSVTGAVGSVTGAVGSVTGNVGGSVASLTANNDKTGYTLSNTGIDNVLDRTAGVETNFTLRQALRLILSSTVAKLSGAATTTVSIRDINDSKARITATVDASGNRTAVTTDVT